MKLLTLILTIKKWSLHPKPPNKGLGFRVSGLGSKGGYIVSEYGPLPQKDLKKGSEL